MKRFEKTGEETQKMTFNIPLTMKDELHERMKRGWNMAAIVRMALREYLDKTRS